MKEQDGWMMDLCRVILIGVVLSVATLAIYHYVL